MLRCVLSSSLREPRLARVFNTIPFPDVQQTFKEWVSFEFPEKWQKVQREKMHKTVEGTDRILVPAESLKA